MKKLKTIEDLSSAIRSWRKRKGVTQEELARIANVSRKVIIDLEKAKPTIQFIVIEKILGVIDVALWIEGDDSEA